jgi:hypothetical protein
MAKDEKLWNLSITLFKYLDICLISKLSVLRFLFYLLKLLTNWTHIMNEQFHLSKMINIYCQLISKNIFAIAFKMYYI